MAAAAIDDSGSIFIPKMCEPVKILDFATRMIQKAGLETPRDIEIALTGLRRVTNWKKSSYMRTKRCNPRATSGSTARLVEV